MTTAVSKFRQVSRRRVHCMRLPFTDPAARGKHQDQQQGTRDTVAARHKETSADPDDPDLSALIGEPTVQEPDFRT
ncbi:hypothetical protein ACFU6I_09100 [Streptomyces sp. NPDC057486]|uniref:MmyB family transcriptional regulator n=1 Tax=Streptomyces sp. NPDC057486 TaxID=3346145 RepID=UPI0036B2B17A